MAEPLHISGPAPIGFYELRRGGRVGYLVIKRAIDICFVIAAAPAALLLVLVCAAFLRADGGSAFYSQLRLGKGGREFRMWKLRTMVVDADAALERYLASDAEARLEWDTHQKLARDPRITPLGRFLRKYSIDELPQLLNVLLGHMSLVGPRPMFSSQCVQYPARAYYNIKPGLTGLWQISVRNGCTFAERAGHDTLYANTMSLGTDLRILFRTVTVVFRGTGL